MYSNLKYTNMVNRENDKTKMFVDETQFPDILESKRKINATLQETIGERSDSQPGSHHWNIPLY